MVRDFVDDGVADDLCLTPGGNRHAFDGPTENADTVRKIWLLRAALGEGNAFVETEERPALRSALRWRLVLYHDLQIPNAIAEFRREIVQRVSHEAREPRAPKIRHESNLRNAGEAGQGPRGRRPRTLMLRTPIALAPTLVLASGTRRTRTARPRRRSREW